MDFCQDVSKAVRKKIKDDTIYREKLYKNIKVNNHVCIILRRNVCIDMATKTGYILKTLEFPTISECILFMRKS
jgi:hypothetical protein